MTLNVDLLSRVGVFTPDLSATVEDLLIKHLKAVTRNQQAEQGRLDDVIGAVNSLHEQHGFLSDEFSTL